jgi:hypothetical protein
MPISRQIDTMEDSMMLMVTRSKSRVADMAGLP